MIIRPPRPPRSKLEVWATILAMGSTAGYYAYKTWNEYKSRKQQKESAKESAMTQAAPFEEPMPFGRTESRGNGNISLKSVAITGDICGLLFSSKIRQEYKNETKDALEIIYTFPVGFGTSLLGMSASIGGKQLKGEVVENKEAEERYEKAVSDGDSAIMVQKSSMGLYTANLGNIKPNETVVVELHCAQLLNFVQGQVRLCIPTVIGERYGNPHAAGGLLDHESASVDQSAHYPFSLELNLWDEIAKGKVSCPTHTVQETRLENGLNIRLDANAVLDRDFVLLMDGVGGKSHSLAVQDDDKWLLAASFAPDMQEQEVSPIALKILVDCSGSMSGGSIRQAQKGLGKILQLLTEKDQVSYSRFGSSVEHITNTMLPTGAETRKHLSKAIEETDANMGGTEMNGALQSTFENIKCPVELPPVILLITDGDVWDVENIISNAKASGHRIFAIGVGNAPAASLLHNLAEKTGGACEFVTENEDMAQAIVRMFHRMRCSVAKNINIDWPAKPVWQSANPRFIYDGETVHAFAIFNARPERGPVLNWEADGRKYSEVCENVEPGNNSDLARLGHAVQVEETASREEKLKIALKYQLVTDLTSLILVYERAEDDKLKGLPKIQQVPLMPAYGHGNYMKVNFADCVCSYLVSPYRDRGYVQRNPQGKRGHKLDTDTKVLPDKKTILKEIAKLWAERVLQLGTVTEFLEPALKAERLDSVAHILAELVAETSLSNEQVYAIFMLWLLGNENDLSRHSLRLLTHARKGVGEEEIVALKQKMDEWLQAA